MSSLFMASLVADEAMPGFVVVLLVGCLVVATFAMSKRFGANRAAVRSLRRRIEDTGDVPFHEARDDISVWLLQAPRNAGARALQRPGASLTRLFSSMNRVAKKSL